MIRKPTFFLVGFGCFLSQRRMKRTKPSKKATVLRSKAGGRSVGKNGYKIIDWVCSSDLLMGCNQTGLLAATTIVVTALFHIPMQDLLDEYNALCVEFASWIFTTNYNKK